MTQQMLLVLSRVARGCTQQLIMAQKKKAASGATAATSSSSYRSAALKKRRCFSSSSISSTGRTSSRTLSTQPAVRRDDAEPGSEHVPETFLTGSSGIYAEQMYEQYLQDPGSVHSSWRKYFDNLESGVAFSEDEYQQPTGAQRLDYRLSYDPTSSAAAAPSDSLGVGHLIRAYQVYGHFAARLDPLNQFNKESFPYRPSSTMDLSRTGGWPPQLTPEYHGFTEADLNRKLVLKGNSSGGNKGYLEELATSPQKVTLRTILNELRKTYCGTLAVEYMHMGDSDRVNWIRERVENPRWVRYDKEKKQHIFERLCFADTFENYLAQKFNTTKRFGLDGGETVIPGLKDGIDRASELGAHSFVIGMPHRGRLNILANVMRKPMPLIFSEFQGSHYNVEEYHKSKKDSRMEPDAHWGMSGDVKYHLGSSMDRTYPDGRRIHLSLVANPSHLECVNPVVCGKIRAKQYYCGNRPEDVRNCVPILLHGDAAVAGQGIVYETMQMAHVNDFDVGGTIHVIIDNQIGFTTNPIHSRSTPYPSDIAKAFGCPIFHCNGDDPLAVSTALETAVEYRHEWGGDVYVHVICYRRNGHNELDQPAFTQPKLYKSISRHPTTLQVYQKRLIDEGTMSKEECEEIKQFVLESYDKDFEASKTYVKKDTDWLSSRWAGFKGPSQRSRIRPTGYDVEELRRIGMQAGTVPEGFKLHRQMEKIFKARRDMAEQGTGIDWGTGEAMAIGSLLLEGNHVRITGQDVQRGTFSHRHAVVKDQNTEEEYTPLNYLADRMEPGAPMDELSRPDTQAGFTCRNSILSEFAVLGFELGYSLENPNSLILWEAQFGDFVNGAQVMIDQFIAAGEDKWMRQSGLVMLLPHGYDGQGAEHSSCRIERFLQSTDEDPHFIPRMAYDDRMQIQHCNWQIVNCTTPANYFHCLRRQVHRDFRKPLVVASPKNLLRHKRCVSSLDDMAPGTMFQRVYDEMDPAIHDNPDQVKTLVFCTGQIYYELLAEREKLGRSDVALVRLEQIAPFAFDCVAENADRYKDAEIVWAQQEPKNMGAYSYCNPRIMTATRELNGDEKRARYVGRPVSAAPATGMSKIHQLEYQEIMDGVFGPQEAED